jgi:hypothetical protein
LRAWRTRDRNRAREHYGDEIFFEFSAEDRRNTVFSQQRFIEGRVKPVRNKTGRRVQRARPIDNRNCQPRRRVHRQKERHDV